jgi:hypothetical protein
LLAVPRATYRATMNHSKAIASMLGILVCLAGCGEAEVSKQDVEKAAQESLSKSAGKPAPPITCPSGLKAKVGSSLTCSITLDGKPYDVAVAVTAIEGSQATYSVEVASKPKG